MALRALVFDFDGVVVDTEVVEYTSVRDVWAEHGLAFPEHRWHAHIGAPTPPDWVVDLSDELGRPVERTAVLARWSVVHATMAAQAEVLPGVRDLLDAAAAAGLPCALASNSDRAWIEGHLERSGLGDRFVAIASVDDVGPARAKPAPDLFLLACRRLGVEPAEAVAFEDSARGAQSAADAGLFTVGVPSGLSRGLAIPHADLVVASLADVTVPLLVEEVARRARS